MMDKTAAVWKVPGYPVDYWFYKDWAVYEWCMKNNVKFVHMCSGGMHGDALRISPYDTEGQLAFKLTWC